MTNSIRSNLIEDQIIKLSACALVNSTSQVDSLLKVTILESELRGHLLELRVLSLLDFDFDFIADTELTLDVL